MTLCVHRCRTSFFHEVSFLNEDNDVTEQSGRWTAKKTLNMLRERTRVWSRNVTKEERHWFCQRRLALNTLHAAHGQELTMTGREVQQI